MKDSPTDPFRRPPSASFLPRALLLAAGLSVVGCGDRSASPDEALLEYSLERQQNARQEHIIGFEPSGMPVYAVDEEGKPVTSRKERLKHLPPPPP
jgi:hypothetical protein